jgi:hypothetical protein
VLLLQPFEMNWLPGLLICASVAAAVFVTDRFRMRLPDIADEKFVRLYQVEHADDRALIIEERRYLARTLGVSYLKLSPQQTWQQLRPPSALFGFDVGLADVEDDLRKALTHAGLSFPGRLPPTVGETIHQFLRARELEARVPAG